MFPQNICSEWEIRGRETMEDATLLAGFEEMDQELKNADGL
jgi:hypothetical protein